MRRSKEFCDLGSDAKALVHFVAMEHSADYGIRIIACAFNHILEFIIIGDEIIIQNYCFFNSDDVPVEALEIERNLLTCNFS